MAPSCATCGAPSSISRVCPACLDVELDAALAEAGAPSKPPAHVLRLVASIRPKAVAS